MHVLVTGAFGRCGTAILDHLDDRYSFKYTDLPDVLEDAPTESVSTTPVDVTDRQQIEAACEKADAIVHLAGYPHVESTFEDVHRPNILGTYNVFEAARMAQVDAVVYASSNHVMGRYEDEFAPELYTDTDVLLDRHDPSRPDSYYAVSKLFGEHLAKFYVSEFEFPKQCYALRIGSVRNPKYDHPYGDALKGVSEGHWDPESDAYQTQVARLKALWLSRRDFAQLVACCLEDDSVTFDVFNAVSDNKTRWFDISHARHVLGYNPSDDGTEWSEEDIPQ